MIVAYSAVTSEQLAADDRSQTDARVWLPDETPLLMRPQVLAERPQRVHPGGARLGEADIWRAIALTLTLATMAIAGLACHDVLMVDGFTLVDLTALTLFELLFGWIAFSAVVSMIVAESSRIAPMKMKHQVAMTLLPSSGVVICQSARPRLAPRMRPASSSSGWRPASAERSC